MGWDTGFKSVSTEKWCFPQISLHPLCVQLNTSGFIILKPRPIRRTLGYLGGAPDPGCELTASTSPKNTEKRSKIILYNEYDESEWSSVMTNHDNSQSNINTSFPYSFSFHPLSGPTKHLPKITFFASFFISDSTVSRKMDHFDISFTSWKFSRSRQLTKPTLLDPVHLPGSPHTNTMPLGHIDRNICHGGDQWKTR